MMMMRSWTRKRVPTATNLAVILVVVDLVIRFSKYYNFFISQPVVIKLWLPINFGDNHNIHDFRRPTVSDSYAQS